MCCPQFNKRSINRLCLIATNKDGSCDTYSGAATYVNSDSNKTFYFKPNNKIYTSVANSDVIGTDIAVPSLNTYVQLSNIINPDQCKNICNVTNNCNAFSYTTDTTKNCWFKKNVGTNRFNTNFNSTYYYTQLV